MIRKFRIAFLLFILATVAHQAWWERRDLTWKDNLYVAVHPVNADGSPQVAHYLANMKQADLESVTEFFAEESTRYGLGIYQPLALRLGSSIDGHPPRLPQHRSMWQSILWSLQFRWWAWRNSPAMPVKPKIRLYLLYHDPRKTPALAHSTALSKGRIGLVNVFGSVEYQAQNAVVVAHELLHTLGATDKYDMSSNLPLYPFGYAEPDKSPLHPQRYAELMAGRIPLNAATAEMPNGLADTLIGPATAAEIGWTSRR